MNIALVIGMALLVAIFLIFFTNIGGDYSKKTNKQLLELWPLHEANVRAARSAGSTAHKKAVEKMSALTSEMKKRGLLKSDYTQENEVLDSLSRKLFSRSLDEIKNLAKEHDAVALYQLGMIFRGVKELSSSIKCMIDSANLGNVDAQYALGWAFMTEGSGVPRDACETMKWFKIAAAQGHTEARKALDVALKSFPEAEAGAAFAEAEKWLTRKTAVASQFGTELQQTKLSLASHGPGANNNALEVALSELEQLAQSGDSKAQLRLGEMYYAGKEVPQDYRKAAGLFSMAAESSNPDAQLYLGTMYESGEGMAKNSVKAMEWYVKAAEGGNAMAQFILSTRIANP